MKFGTDKAGTESTLHPEGTWDAVVVGQEVKETKTHRPMIVLTWKTSKGKLRSWHTWVEEHPFIFLDPMYQIGLTKEFFDAEPEMEDVAMELLKRRCLLDVSHEDNQKGGLVARIVSYGKIPDSGIKKAPEKKASTPDDLGDEPF